MQSHTEVFSALRDTCTLIVTLEYVDLHSSRGRHRREQAHSNTHYELLVTYALVDDDASRASAGDR